MSAITFFYQPCPTCGRSLRVPVKYFGRQMCCTHCKGQFVASPPDLRPAVAEGIESKSAPRCSEVAPPLTAIQLGEV